MKITPRRSITIVALALLMLMSSAFPVHADEVENAVTAIRAKYNQIEGANLQSQVIEFESNDDPAYGKVTKYLQNGQLVKALYTFGLGDHGGADETYYYDNGQLFFIYVAQSSWGFTGRTLPSGESETIDTLTEHRLYFANGGLIRHLKKEVKSSDYDALASLIAKAPNVPHEDPALASAAKMRGFQIPGVQNPTDLETMLLGQ